MRNACVGGVCAMHTWGLYIHNVHVGVHAQCMCGGGDMHNVHMGGACMQCACGGCMRNEHVG